MSKSRSFLRTKAVDGIRVPGDVNRLLRGFSEGQRQIKQPACLDFNRSCMSNLLFMPPLSAGIYLH